VSLCHVLRKNLPQSGFVSRPVHEPLVAFQARHVVGLEVHLHAVLVGSPISAIVKYPVTDRALRSIIIVVVVGHPLL